MPRFPVHCRKLKIRILWTDQGKTFFVYHRKVTQVSPFPIFSFSSGNSKAFGNRIRLQ